MLIDNQGGKKKSVEINNKDLNEADDHNQNYKYERGEQLDIDVCVKAVTDVTDAQIEADIYGYRYSSREPDKVSDTTDTFDLDKNDNDCYSLALEIPDKMDVDYYKLRIRVADRDGISFEKMYELHIKGVDRSAAVQIKDFSLNPESIVAGRAFTSIVKVKNIGDYDLEDLKLTLSVPDLNLKVSEYLDELEADESKTFEELLLRIPECAKKGDYDVEIKVEFDEYEEVMSTTTITVLESQTCPSTISPITPTVEDKTVITVPASQELSQGTSVVYPIVIANSGANSKTYTINVAGTSSWASTKLDPSSVVVVPSGQSKTVYLYLSANPNAEIGGKVFTLTVESGSESKQVSLTASITKSASDSSWTSLRKGLEIGLVVLVVVLIIIGLVIGFSKLRENKKEPEPYY